MGQARLDNVYTLYYSCSSGHIYKHIYKRGFMLKKLIKFGNSNALILDRAIMELLEIQEGSTVKLQTDGKSLIITRATSPQMPTPVALTGFETLMNIGQAQREAFKANPQNNELLKEWAPGTEKYAKLVQFLTPIMNKYIGEMHKLQSEEFIAETDALAIKCHGNKSSDEFIKGYKALRDLYAPNYKHYLKDLREAYEKAGYPAELIDKLDTY